MQECRIKSIKAVFENYCHNFSYSPNEQSLWFVGEINGNVITEMFVPNDTKPHYLFRQEEKTNYNAANADGPGVYKLCVFAGTRYFFVKKCGNFRFFNSFSHMSYILSLPVEALKTIILEEDKKEYYRLEESQKLHEAALISCRPNSSIVAAQL